MTAGRNAFAEQHDYQHAQQEAWQRARLELLQPQHKQRLNQRRQELAVYMLAALAIFVCALAYMVLEAKIGAAGHEVNSIQAQIAEVNNLALRTEYEIGSLSSLARVESYAKLRLGMVYPDINAVQYLHPATTDNIAAALALLEEEAQQPAAATLEVSEGESESESESGMFGAWSVMIEQYFSGLAFAAEE